MSDFQIHITGPAHGEAPITGSATRSAAPHSVAPAFGRPYAETAR